MALFAALSIEGMASLAAVLGLAVGYGTAEFAIRLTPLPHPASDRKARLGTCLLTAVLFALAAWLLIGLQSQQVDEVRPDAFWRDARVAYHGVLLSLLVAATVTDVRDYVIPDAITLSGLFLGLGFAFLSGDLQTIHLWVDWNEAIPGLRGPGLPEWIRQHPHWHGLAWSAAGAAMGAGVTWLVRALSGWLLGKEALGFGDVTLMAMAGSFLGWQPVLIAFAVAPLLGTMFAVITRVSGGRSYIPYGPSLAAAVTTVTLGWKWIWTLEIDWSATNRFSLRRFFGDAIGMAIVAAIALTAFALLLGALRLARPSSSQAQEQTPSESADGV